MAITDLVPCFYTGQNYRWEKPAKLLPRFELHEIKRMKLGKFIENGKVFLFLKQVIEVIRTPWNDGPLGRGNLIPFVKPHTSGDKLHYECPMAGDRGIFARHHRRFIRVSSRSLFNFQVLPVVVRAAV